MATQPCGSIHGSHQTRGTRRQEVYAGTKYRHAGVPSLLVYKKEECKKIHQSKLLLFLDSPCPRTHAKISYFAILFLKSGDIINFFFDKSFVSK